MRSIRAVLPGLLLLTTLGCDLLLKRESDETRPAPAPPSAPVPAAPAPIPQAVPPAATQGVQPAAPPSASAAPEAASGPVLQLTEGAAAASIAVNQLKVTPAPVAGPIVAPPLVPGPVASTAKPRVNSSKTPVWHEVTVYAIFGAPFSRRIELRAHDAKGGELGRSEREPALSQAGDSARYVTFRFDPRMPLDQVRTFDVFVEPLPEPPAETPKPKVTKPAPQPEPQFIRPAQPGLVPKDP